MFWKVLGIILLVILAIVLLFIAVIAGAIGILVILAKAADELGPEEFAKKIFNEIKPNQLDTVRPYLVELNKVFAKQEEPVKKTTKKKTILNESKKK